MRRLIMILESCEIETSLKVEESKYGFRYFDKLSESSKDSEEEEEQEEDQFDIQSCPKDCCDVDCECDDCVRCSTSEIETDVDQYSSHAAAA